MRLNSANAAKCGATGANVAVKEERDVSEEYQDDWSRFSVGRPRRGAGFNPSCVELDYVAHAAHVGTAVEIVRVRQVRAGLVYDESRLNTERIPVVWLSPNYWRRGSRYGNIKFHFDWRELIDGMRYYWVGAMHYKPWAPRILVTRHDRSALGLREYDPTSGDGPWWHDRKADVHYWHSGFCLEIMVENDLALGRVVVTDANKHHEVRCNQRSGGSCPDAGNPAEVGMARFVASLLSREAAGAADLGLAEPSVRFAWHTEVRDLAEVAACVGTVVATDASARPLVRAILAAYGRRAVADMEALIALFASADEYRETAGRLIEESVGLASGKLK